MDGFDAAGDTLINGSLPQTAIPQCTSSPISSQTQEPSPGVAANQPVMLEKSEGASAEVTVHKGDALQSLRLSMPMQETELCKHKIMWSELPLPLLTFCILTSFCCGMFWFLARAHLFAIPLSVCYINRRIRANHFKLYESGVFVQLPWPGDCLISL